jgi:hypothetical protein
MAAVTVLEQMTELELGAVLAEEWQIGLLITQLARQALIMSSK